MDRKQRTAVDLNPLGWWSSSISDLFFKGYRKVLILDFLVQAAHLVLTSIHLPLSLHPKPNNLALSYIAYPITYSLLFWFHGYLCMLPEAVVVNRLIVVMLMVVGGESRG